MTDLEQMLAALEQWAEKATPGPWRVQPEGISKDCRMSDLIVGPQLGEQVCHVYCDNAQDRANAQLIATARTDIPRLIQAVRVLSEGLKQECCCMGDGLGRDACCDACDSLTEAAKALRGDM